MVRLLSLVLTLLLYTVILVYKEVSFVTVNAGMILTYTLIISGTTVSFQIILDLIVEASEKAEEKDHA